MNTEEQDVSCIQRYIEYQNHDEAKIKSTMDEWNTLKQEYETVREKVSEMIGKLYWNDKVSLTKYSYIPVGFNDTNRFMVLGGDGYFIEMSGVDTLNLIERRIKEIDKRLTDLSTEIKAVRDRKATSIDFLNEQLNAFEIKEPVTVDEQVTVRRCIMTDKELIEHRRKMQKRAIQGLQRDYQKSSVKPIQKHEKFTCNESSDHQFSVDKVI
ncbi:hypothetical protein GJ496_009492 [Pomphorhynchus laevis]|nr:hypothetical protein GJ496_009492 [Pomphorhynchus laevis]